MAACATSCASTTDDPSRSGSPKCGRWTSTNPCHTRLPRSLSASHCPTFALRVEARAPSQRSGEPLRLLTRTPGPGPHVIGSEFPLNTAEEWFPTHPSPCWCWVACCLGGRTSTSTDAADSNSNNMYSRRRRSTSQRPKVVARARGNVGASVPADLFFCAHLLPPSPLNINNLSLVSMCHILA